MDNVKEETQQSYASPQLAVLAQSRDLENYLERLEEQNNRLANLMGRLSEFRGRLDGSETGSDGSAKHPPNFGLLPRLDAAIAENLSLVSQIDDLTQRFESIG